MKNLRKRVARIIDGKVTVVNSDEINAHYELHYQLINSMSGRPTGLPTMPAFTFFTGNGGCISIGSNDTWCDFCTSRDVPAVAKWPTDNGLKDICEVCIENKTAHGAERE